MSCCIIHEGPEVMTEKWRRARKGHRCCECYSHIKAGDNYEYVRGLWEGEWSEFKTCEPCADLRESLRQVCCPGYGDLAEAYTDWLLDSTTNIVRVNPGSHAAKLVPGYLLEEAK